MFIKWFFMFFLLIGVNSAYSATTVTHHKKQTKHHVQHTKYKHPVHHIKQHLAAKPKPVVHKIEAENEVLQQPPVSMKTSIPAYLLNAGRSEMRLLDTVKKPVVEFVDNIVSTVRYSAYKLGGKHFDTKKGVYIVDCSSFVDHILQNTCPNAYASLVDATGADRPSTQHFYHFFSDLSYGPDHYWNKVNNVGELRAGDILVIRYKNSRGFETGGHVMVVMHQPIRNTDVYYVRVADSASAGHSDDTREDNSSGVGIGTLLLKANNAGRPTAYAWGVGGYWKSRVNFAMARPVENATYVG